MKLRLDTAREELTYKDRAGFWDLVLVNDDLEATYARLKSFVQEHYPGLDWAQSHLPPFLSLSFSVPLCVSTSWLIITLPESLMPYHFYQRYFVGCYCGVVVDNLVLVFSPTPGHTGWTFLPVYKFEEAPLCSCTSPVCWKCSNQIKIISFFFLFIC